VDGRQFDGLTRVLSAGTSRRRTLTVLAAALTSGSLLTALPDGATAMTRKQRRQCKRQGGSVCNLGDRPAEYCCQSGGTCTPTPGFGTPCCGPVTCDLDVHNYPCCPPGDYWQCCPKGSIANCCGVDATCCPVGSASGLACCEGAGCCD
jgi:hypothetical protein